MVWFLRVLLTGHSHPSPFSEELPKRHFLTHAWNLNFSWFKRLYLKRLRIVHMYWTLFIKRLWFRPSSYLGGKKWMNSIISISVQKKCPEMVGSASTNQVWTTKITIGGYAHVFWQSESDRSSVLCVDHVIWTDIKIWSKKRKNHSYDSALTQMRSFQYLELKFEKGWN